MYITKSNVCKLVNESVKKFPPKTKISGVSSSDQNFHPKIDFSGFSLTAKILFQRIKKNFKNVHHEHKFSETFIQIFIIIIKFSKTILTKMNFLKFFIMVGKTKSSRLKKFSFKIDFLDKFSHGNQKFYKKKSLQNFNQTYIYSHDHSVNIQTKANQVWVAIHRK